MVPTIPPTGHAATPGGAARVPSDDRECDNGAEAAGRRLLAGAATLVGGTTAFLGVAHIRDRYELTHVSGAW
ncbi:MAG TPA: hypothetical protein VKJ07_14290, partial [Mycobacteriales bacterium]|nr:hypothetical protein [Mycobacteriales bacterium]